MMIKDVVVFFIQTILLFLLQLVGIVTGLIVVPIMLMFGEYNESTAKYFTHFNKDKKWVKEVFPRVFWPWDNIEDGSLGDHRGWWDANCFGGDSRKPFNKFWWMAVRNPFNNFKRYVLGCDIRNYEMSLLAGQEYVRDDFYNTGWQFLKASPKNGRIPRYQFYLVKRYGDSNRALVVQIGNKIKLDHNYTIESDEYDYWKGWTLEVNPFKDIS